MKEIGRFKAKNDSGREYTIIEYQEYADEPNSSYKNSRRPAGKTLLTSTGFHVKTIDFGTFQIVETKDTVRRSWGNSPPGNKVFEEP